MEVKLMIDIITKGERIESFNAMEPLPRSAIPYPLLYVYKWKADK